MAIRFFLLLILIVIPLSAWLAFTIWHACSPRERASFLLIVPTSYLAWKYKDKPGVNIQPALTCNLVALPILLLVAVLAFILPSWNKASYDKEHAEARTRQSAEWTRWCKEKNDATYDPTLGTCVENSKAEAVARSVNANILGQLISHLGKKGIKGELDESRSVGALQARLVTPEIAKAAAFHFTPLSMSQPPVTVLLCVSESACEKYEEKAKEAGAVNLVRNANLLLVLPPETGDDSRFNALKQAFLLFKPA